jgi:hypothetical protein
VLASLLDSPLAAHAATPHVRELMTEAMPEPINMPCKNARVDSRAEAAANSRLRLAARRRRRDGSSIWRISLPRDGRFQALDRSALRPATPGREGLSDGLLLHPHTIVSMLINDLADIDNEVFLFLDDYHSVTDPRYTRRSVVSAEVTPHRISPGPYNALGATAIAWRIACQEPVARGRCLCPAL